jgi:hypothetical protein
MSGILTVVAIYLCVVLLVIVLGVAVLLVVVLLLVVLLLVTATATRGRTAPADVLGFRLQGKV